MAGRFRAATGVAAALLVGAQLLFPVGAWASPADVRATTHDVCLAADDGSLVRLAGEPGGTPYLLVHGWLSTTLDAAGGESIASSPFARTVAWADGSGGSPEDTRSLEERLAALPDATVYAFDYSRASSAWVGDSGVADQLGAAIECLAEESGRRVGVVAHSMGGLAMRAALDDEPALVDDIRSVVTVGTPNLGSDAAVALDAIVDASWGILGHVPLISLAVSQAVNGCVDELVADARTGCDIVPWLRTAIAGTIGSGVALRAGSEQISSLAPWPDELDVHAIAGSTDVRVRVGDVVPVNLVGVSAGLRAAGIRLPAFVDRTIGLGDGLVSEASATAGADSSAVVRCEAVVDVSNLLGVRDSVAAATTSGDALTAPCAHDALFENDEVVTDVVAQFQTGRGRPTG